jgi:hypothetical protein
MIDENLRMPQIKFPPCQGLKSDGKLVASTIQFLTSGDVNRP